jgi:hypothetical protein
MTSTLTCKRATQLISASLERKLPLRQRIRLWLHLFVCQACLHFQRQLMLLKRAIRLCLRQIEDKEPSAHLSAEARERIRRALDREGQ